MALARCTSVETTRCRLLLVADLKANRKVRPGVRSHRCMVDSEAGAEYLQSMSFSLFSNHLSFSSACPFPPALFVTFLCTLVSQFF